MTDKIIVSHLRKSYGRGADAVNDLSFEIPKGCAFALLGRNGAGKTTLLKGMSGYLYPDSGESSIFGFDPYRDDVEVKRILAYVSDQNVYNAVMTPRETLDILKNFYPRYDESLAMEIAARFKIDLDKRIGTCSLGQARQVNLLAALARRPEVLILDEPTLGLDVVARRNFMEMVIDRMNCDGVTVIYSSHMISEIEDVAERTMIIDQGKLMLEAEVEQLKSETFLVTADPGFAVPDGVRLLRKFRKNGKCSFLVEGKRSLLEPLRQNRNLLEFEPLSLEDIFVCLTEQEETI